MSRPALALSASGARFSMTLRGGDGAILGAVDAEARSLSGDLFRAIDGLLRPARLTPVDLGELRVDRGPGSYTGLRVALTFARVLAEQAGVAVLHATSLELMAISAWRRSVAPPSRPVRLILDARRDRWHTARVGFDGARARLLDPPRAVAMAELRGIVGADELLLVPPALLAPLLPGFADLGDLAALPEYGAAELFDPWLTPLPAAPTDLEPLYLMGPYTERPA